MISEDKLKEIVQLAINEIKDKTGTSSLDDTKDFFPEDFNKNIFVPNPKERAALESIKKTTPARIGVWRAGNRPLTCTMLKFRADHAVAKDAVLSHVDEQLISRCGFLKVKTKIVDKDHYLTRPDLGRRLDTESIEKIKSECPHGAQVQIVVADGLSAKAIEANIDDVLAAFKRGLNVAGISTGKDIFVEYGRVGITDHIGEILNPEVLILFVGERPGLGTDESMSAYMTYRPSLKTVESDRTMLSNIHKGGTPPAEAGAYLVDVIKKILAAKASGVNLNQ